MRPCLAEDPRHARRSLGCGHEGGDGGAGGRGGRRGRVVHGLRHGLVEQRLVPAVAVLRAVRGQSQTSWADTYVRLKMKK
jgi:hypothetical protein